MQRFSLLTSVWLLLCICPVIAAPDTVQAIPDSGTDIEIELTAENPPAGDGFEIELDVTPDTAAVIETVYVDENGDTIPPESLAAAPPAIEKVPELVSFIEAEYPPEELRQGIEGTVLAEFIVTDSGRVESLKVLRGITPALDSAAVRAIRAFVFTPALAEGEAVPVIIQYEYHFAVAEQAKKIDEYVNFSGVLREKGTRNLIPDAMVVITFPDMVQDSAITVPWDVYLEKIGRFDGQHVEDGRLVTVTDSAGRFAFKSVPAADITVTFPVTGYRAWKEKETIETGKRTDVVYWLERVSYDEYEIVVYGQAEKKEVAKTSLNTYEVKKIPGFGGDAVKVIQTLPGVARPSFIGGDIIVRGSDTQDTRFFLDGVDIPLLFHYGGLKSTYNSDALASIDLYPGGFNSRFGNCIGGVVEIKGRRPRTDRWHYNIDVNFLDAYVLAEGPVTDDISFMVTLRRSYIANMLTFAIENIAALSLPFTVVPYYQDAVARLQYLPRKDEEMFLTFFGSEDKMDIIIEDVRGGSEEVTDDESALSQDLSFYRFIYGWDRTFDEQLRNSLRAAAGGDEQVFNIFGFGSANADIFQISLRNQLTWQPAPAYTFNFGLDSYTAWVDYSINILSAGALEPSVDTALYTQYGAYANCEYTPREGVMIMPGIRYDYYNEIRQGKPSLRLTSHYIVAPDHKIKCALGTYNQTPRPIGQALDSVWGNPELPASEAHHYVLGYEWQITDLISADVQTYYNTQRLLPNSTDSINAVTGDFVNLLPDLEGRMYGLEIMLRHKQGQRFFGWFSYTLSRSERRSPRAPDSRLEGDWNPATWYLFDKDQTHHLQLLGTWKLPFNFEIGTRIRYVTGDPVTPNLGYTEGKFEYNAEYGYYENLLGAFRSDRMGPFFQVDLRLDYKWIHRTWMISAYLDLLNTNYFLYNSPEFYSYSYDKDDRVTRGSVFIPSLGLKAEF